MAAWRKVFEDIVAPTRPSSRQLSAWLVPVGRSPLVDRNAASVIVARVRLVSLLFALLVPLCAPVDVLVFDGPAAWGMVALRIATALLFLALAWPRDMSESRRPYARALRLLLGMSLIPSLFYLVSVVIVGDTATTPQQQVVMRFYALMPTVVLAGLAIFPLAALELLLLSLPALATAVLGLAWAGEPLSWVQHAPLFWFMAMAMGVAMFSGMAQSHYMESLVTRAMTDPLTGALNRRAGSEALARLFAEAREASAPMAVAFFDIDHFKVINDRHGHDAGDQVLVRFADALRRGLGRHDLLVRWGGEEFLALLPAPGAREVPVLMARLREAGFGEAPDGVPLTASAGWAERLADEAGDGPALVALADQRMYQAKHAGRARGAGPAGQVLPLIRTAA